MAQRGRGGVRAKPPRALRSALGGRHVQLSARAAPGVPRRRVYSRCRIRRTADSRRSAHRHYRVDHGRDRASFGRRIRPTSSDSSSRARSSSTSRRPARPGRNQTDPGVYRVVAVHTPEQFSPVFGVDLFDTSVAAGVGNLEQLPAGPHIVSGSTSFDDDAMSSRCPTTRRSDTRRAPGSRPSRSETCSRSTANRTERGFRWPIPTARTCAPHSFSSATRTGRMGGIMQRFSGLHIPGLGVTFDGATPTDSCDADGADCRFPDRRYRVAVRRVGGLPARPLNLLADLNAARRDRLASIRTAPCP